MKSFIRLTVASFKEFVRDRTALFFTFAFPVIFMVIFGLIFSGDHDINYRVGLVTEDSSPISQGVAMALHEAPVFEIEDGERETLLEDLRQGDLRAVVVIPAGLEDALGDAGPAPITVYHDPSQTTSSQIILSVLQQIVDETNLTLTEQPPILVLEAASVLVHDLRTIDFMVPGILAFSLLVLGLFGSLTLVEWREKKVLKRLGATPLRRSNVVFSQVFYRLVLALVQTAIIIGIGYLAFGVQMIGNWFLLVAIVLLGTLTFVSLGYLAVSRARTVEGAMPIVQLIQFPMLFLSGIFFSVEMMPDFMRPVVLIMPATYLGDALRQVMVDAIPMYPLTTNVAVLAAWLVGSLLLAIRFFRWE